MNLSKIRPAVACVATIAAAALIAGCGGSSNTAASSKAATLKAEIQKVISGGTITTNAGSTSTSSGVSKTAGASFADASNCKQLDGVGTKFAQAMAAASSGGKLNYQAAVKAYQQLADAAPSAIRPDLEAMSQSFTSFANAIAKSGYKPGKTPSPSQILALESAAKSFSSGKLATAEKDVEAWAVKNCA